MSTVSRPAARKIHLKKVAKASLAIIPLKRDVLPEGCAARNAPASPSTTTAAPARRNRRAVDRRRARSSAKSAIDPKVSTSSGRKLATLARLFSISCSIWVPVLGTDVRHERHDQRVQRGVDGAQDRLWVKAEEDRDRAERIEREPLAPVEVGVPGVRLVELAEE